MNKYEIEQILMDLTNPYAGVMRNIKQVAYECGREFQRGVEDVRANSELIRLARLSESGGGQDPG